MTLHNSVLAWIKQQALLFTEHYAPDELPFFSTLWDQTTSLLNENALERKQRKQTRVLIQGLPFAKDKRLTLTVPQTILTITAVIFELREITNQPTSEQLRKVAQYSARTFGASEQHVEELVNRVVPAIEHLLIDGVLGNLIEITAANPRAETIFISQLDASSPGVQTSSYSYAEGRRIACSTNFDILVDEVFEYTVCIGSMKPRKIWDLSGTKRGMLWLTMKNVGKLTSHAEIRTLYDLADGQMVHHYRKGFAEYLGELSKIVIPTSPQNRSKGWAIPNRGWSFCWLREHNDNSLSKLIAKLPGQILSN